MSSLTPSMGFPNRGSLQAQIVTEFRLREEVRQSSAMIIALTAIAEERLREAEEALERGDTEAAKEAIKRARPLVKELAEHAHKNRRQLDFWGSLLGLRKKALQLLRGEEK